LYVLRRLERWLHQHIFKVGWLVTKKYQTTTILYYAVFLPGIFLHEFILWFVAGFLNVRADRAISWPEKQEIGELKLNFVKLAKNTDPIRLAVINTAPLAVSLVIVTYIANNIIDFRGFLNTFGVGYIEDVTGALGKLTSTPDFWIWIYLTFAISNTMFPDTSKLRGWRIIIGILVVIGVILFAIGAGRQVIFTALTPISNTLNALSTTLVVIIFVDVIMVGILGTLEAIIERITGDSATFKNGKMITMRREELLKQRSEAWTSVRDKKPAAISATVGGPPSIYRFPLPIPGAPGKEPVTRGAENITIAPSPTPMITPPSPVTRNQPAVIPGSATSGKPASPSENKPAAFAPSNRPALPGAVSGNPASPPENKPAAFAPSARPALPATGAPPTNPPSANRPSILGAATSRAGAPASENRPSIASPGNRPAPPISAKPVELDDEDIEEEDDLDEDDDELFYEDADDLP
jgi:hypothetical protein